LHFEQAIESVENFTGLTSYEVEEPPDSGGDVGVLDMHDLVGNRIEGV
jgi:hypothetical protein